MQTLHATQHAIHVTLLTQQLFVAVSCAIESGLATDGVPVCHTLVICQN